MPSSKPFKTYRQQLKILRSRNLEIRDGSRATTILKREGYYNIINGYKDIFLDTALCRQAGEDRYKPGTTFEHIYALYTFDRAMKSALMDAILKVETFLKTQIAYFFSETYTQNFSYLDINNFDSSNPQKVTRLIAKVSNVITNNSQSGQVYHYLDKYKELPLWVLSKKMTLGETYHFFDALDLSVKEKIAAEFIYEFSHEYGTDVSIDDIRIASMLSEMFRFVNHFRNICAHDDRLFNTVVKNGNKIPRIVLFHKKQPPLFKSRLFDCVIILGFFLTKKDYRTLILQIEHNIDHLSKKLSPNTFNAVLIHMGFPKKWDDIILLP